jgi:hypothetical protein
LIVACAVGCDAPAAAPPSRSSARQPASKAAFYADATLLPDRASARRREEAALAAEVDALCGLLPGVLRVRSSVSLVSPPLAVVVVEHDAGSSGEHADDDDGAEPRTGEAESLAAMIETITTGVVPGARTTVLTLPHTSWTSSTSPTSRPQEGQHDSARSPLRVVTRTVLWLALGITLGVLFERAATRRGPRRV